MKKTVSTGERVTTIILDGSECAVKFSRPFNAFSACNNGNTDIYIALESGKSIGDDGVLSLPAGSSDTYFHGRQIDTCYLLGAAGGKVIIKAQNTDTNSFEQSGGGSGGEENTIEKIKVNGAVLPIESDKSVDVPVPTKNSQLQNDSDFATKMYVGEQIANIDKLSRSIVEELPTDEEAQDNVIYMIMVADISGNDKYQEYLKIDGTLQMIGDTSVDLTDYAKKTDIPTELPANGGNADTVNNHTVGTDVPANAKFTDTIYTLPAATAETLGGIKPDNVTVAVNENGVLSAQKAIDTIYSTNPRPNMYRNTKTMDDPIVWTDISWYNLWVADGLFNGLVVKKRVNGDYLGLRQRVICQKGHTYAFSAFLKCDVDNPNVQVYGSSVQGNLSILIDTLHVTLNDDMQWYSVVFTPTVDVEAIRFESAYGYATGNPTTLYIAGMKLEEGNFATAWAPHPDDYAMESQQKTNTRLAVQIAHPNNYLIYDDLDKPSAMVAIPKLYLDEVINGAEHIVHPAFQVNGAEQNAIYISKYQNIIENDRAYSLPMKDPVVNINFDQSWTCCKNKGTGWHLMTNAEWGAIALWCKKKGTIPKGNNNYGKDITETNLPQIAIPAIYDSQGKIARTLTGSGGANWYHDGTFAGIADLNGNVNEWIGDMRLVYGELQVIPFNNAASGECDVSASSADWKAINANATSYDDLYITPDGSGTTANSVKLDWLSNHWQWQGATIVTLSKDYHYATFASTTYNSISDFCRCYIQALVLLPEDGATAGDYGNDYFYAINGEAERCAARGGDWGGGAITGVFALNFNYPHLSSVSSIGARSSYINTSAQPLAMALELTDEDYII